MPRREPINSRSTIYRGRGTSVRFLATDPANSMTSTARAGARDDQEMGRPNAFFRSEVRHQSLPKCFRKRCGVSSSAIDTMRVAGAEFLGTFFMMFAVCGIIASTKMVEGGGLLEYACGAGFAILVVIFAVGPISGAHVNPSITLAYAAIGDFPWSKVPLYVSAQISGSAFATFVGMAVYGTEADFANTRPLRGVHMAFFSELIASSLVMFLGASLSDNAQAVNPTTTTASTLFSLPVSGGSLNPVRSLGPAVVSWKFESLWLYFTAPTLGALAGALLYRLLKLQHTQQSCAAATQTEAARSVVSGSVVCETNLSPHRLNGH
ncbi:hypothetical protein H6P81_002479 [Aristolochia fimbriata]|uniref:Aquaporin NIP7-1 n=1 Tax=Aristolochia fimbriata TaxID=158543 RepID=A0AAV7FB22_ARIFI|nr:hypothetical protein H6P81_002479 [Aristolochia fimbriata]